MSYKPTDEPTDSGPVRYLQCRYCGKQTLVETLSNYGARCFDCFESYCAKAGESSSDPARIRASIARIGQGGEKGPKAWAYALRERHQNGEWLTSAQVSAYHSVIRDGEAA